VTGNKRSSFAPNVPALSESSNAAIRALGEGLMPSTWYGVIGPPGIAPDIVAAIHSAVERALKDPEYAKVMAKIGFDTVPGSPAEFRAVVARTASAWSEAARAYNFQPE
jgi:tripartite-type tricarboxylate transporter receptor subunit TctC